MPDCPISIPEDFYKQIGQNLSALRRAIGLSQKEIASVLNLSYQQIQKYEQGKNRIPLEKLLILQHFYNVSLDVILAEALFSPTRPKDYEHDARARSALTIYLRMRKVPQKKTLHKIERLIDVFLEP